MHAWLVLAMLGAFPGGGGMQAAARSSLAVLSFQPGSPLCRAGRPAAIVARLVNRGDAPVTAACEIACPAGVRLAGTPAASSVRLRSGDERSVSWTVEAGESGERVLGLTVSAGGGQAARASLRVLFLPAVPKRKLAYVPEPRPVRTPLLIGAHNCPLWEADKPQMWQQIVKHPERTPALGFYAQENPQVADWETKWAVEHGVSFFIYCWYRNGQGGAVRTNFGSAIHDALFKSRYVGKMKFTIMWENQSRGTAGVADERDLMQNLLPYWIDNYFKHPSYLKVDNKPVLFIYRPEFLVQDLGGVENVARAFGKMRQACKAAGFDGLTLLGEYRGLDPEHLRLMKQLGLDYTFAYCWYVPNSPSPRVAVDTQLSYIEQTQKLGILPQVVTVSQGWTGWNDEGSIWRLPPHDWEGLLQRARDFVATLPPGELGSKMLLLDNWNEWGEGHFIAPYREYGFGYLDAVRRVFAPQAPEPHVDLLPEDVGLGPYDTAYKEQASRAEGMKRLAGRRVRKGAPEPGLVAWWAFDEDDSAPVALDYAGHGLGGEVRKAKRAPGIDGKALVCDGGCVVVPPAELLSVTDALTVECWVRTDLAGQDNKWVVNRVLSGGTSTGYRLGVLDGKPCLEVPLTDWSHHLTARDPLPTGRWVHLAGTFDGKVMRIYVDGVEQGSMERPGPAGANALPLHLGSYEAGHPAYFTGLLDEVKLYSRALTAAEVRVHYERLAAGAR